MKQVSVNRSMASSGVWVVEGETQRFTVRRKLVLDPLPPRPARRVLVNDTIITTTNRAKRSTLLSSHVESTDVIGIYVRHRATIASTPEDVDSAVVPGR